MIPARIVNGLTVGGVNGPAYLPFAAARRTSACGSILLGSFQPASARKLGLTIDSIRSGMTMTLCFFASALATGADA